MTQTAVYCPSCGHELPSSAGFCGDCGHDLTSRASAPEPASRFCRECGVGLPAGAEFCRACGAGQAAADAAPAPGAFADPALLPAPVIAEVPSPPPPPAADSSWFSPPPQSLEVDALPPEVDAPPPAVDAGPLEPPTPPTESVPVASGTGEPARRSRRILVGSLVLVVLAAGGAAAYLTLGGKNDDHESAAKLGKSSLAQATATSTVAEATSTAADSEPAPTATATPELTATSTPTPTPDPGVVPEGPPEQFTDDIRTLLSDFHKAIVAHHDRAAWNLLSARKRAKELRVDGYAKWRAAQESLAPYLDPSGLEVTVRDVNRKTGVAVVAVSGMGWSAPGARCSEWSGFTWVKYEDGEWRYDPGFSTTPQRQREWKDRYQELLGASC